jgi:hypothetical protein
VVRRGVGVRRAGDHGDEGEGRDQNAGVHF